MSGFRLWLALMIIIPLALLFVGMCLTSLAAAYYFWPEYFGVTGGAIAGIVQFFVGLGSAIGLGMWCEEKLGW